MYKQDSLARGQHKHIPVCFHHTNSLGCASKIFRVSTTIISRVYKYHSVDWPPVLSSAVTVRHECKKVWSTSKQRIQTGKVPGKWKGFVFFVRMFESLGLLKVFWGAFTVDCVCFPGSLPLHHCEKLCRNCGKTREQGWHPEDYETSLWPLCITRDLLERRSLHAWRIHIWSTNGHGHSIIPGPPGYRSVSCPSVSADTQLFSLSLR